MLIIFYSFKVKEWGITPYSQKKYITQQVNPSQQLNKFKFNP